MSNSEHLDINPEAIQQLAALKNDQPLHMVNYLKYNEVADDSGRTGKEIYKEYMTKAMPFFAKVNAEIVFKGEPSLMVIGSADEALWDEILIVTYASKKDFIGMITAEGYPAHIRKQALKDSRLIFCK